MPPLQHPEISRRHLPALPPEGRRPELSCQCLRDTPQSKNPRRRKPPLHPSRGRRRAGPGPPEGPQREDLSPPIVELPEGQGVR